MLDKRSIALLDIINGICSNCGYKVLDIEELVSLMPKEYGVDIETVRESISALSEREYISVKYEDEKEVCLSPLPKGRMVFENKVDGEIKSKKDKKSYFAYCFLGSFFGAITPIFIAVMIFLFRGI